MELQVGEKWTDGDFPPTIKTVFFGGLHPHVEKQHLRAFCETEFGPVEAVQIIWDYTTGLSKLYGFVHFANESDANRVKEMKSIRFFGKQMDVRDAIRADKNTKLCKLFAARGCCTRQCCPYSHTPPERLRDAPPYLVHPQAAANNYFQATRNSPLAYPPPTIATPANPLSQNTPYPIPTATTFRISPGSPLPPNSTSPSEIAPRPPMPTSYVPNSMSNPTTTSTTPPSILIGSAAHNVAPSAVLVPASKPEGETLIPVLLYLTREQLEHLQSDSSLKAEYLPVNTTNPQKPTNTAITTPTNSTTTTTNNMQPFTNLSQPFSSQLTFTQECTQSGSSYVDNLLNGQWPQSEEDDVLLFDREFDRENSGTTLDTTGDLLLPPRAHTFYY